MVINVENMDEEQIERENDLEFWQMIEQSRREAIVSFEKVKAKLLADERAERARKAKRK